MQENPLQVHELSKGFLFDYLDSVAEQVEHLQPIELFIKEFVLHDGQL
jgi:hypothetical protein